jgi:hypothetical protein
MQNDFVLSRGRRPLVLAIAGVHLVALLAYAPQHVRAPAAQPAFLTLVFPPSAKQAAKAPVPAAAAPRTARPRLPAPAVEAPAAMTAVPAPEAAPPEIVSDLAFPDPGIKEKSTGTAGVIDKELREKSFDLRDRKKLAYEKPRFERMMEAAGKPRGVVVEEIVAPGGRRITRIDGKCYYAPHGNHSIMRDPFKNGPPLITQANCPREK